MLLQVSFTEYRLFCRSLLQNIVSFIGLFKFKGWDVEAFLVRVTSRERHDIIYIYIHICIYIYIYIYICTYMPSWYVYHMSYIYITGKDITGKDVWLVTSTSRLRERHHGTTMGWLRLVGSLKLQVSFTEYRLFYRALLQKRPTILRSLLIVATPYLWSIILMCLFLLNDDIWKLHTKVTHRTHRRGTWQKDDVSCVCDTQNDDVFCHIIIEGWCLVCVWHTEGWCVMCVWHTVRWRILSYYHRRMTCHVCVTYPLWVQRSHHDPHSSRRRYRTMIYSLIYM